MRRFLRLATAIVLANISFFSATGQSVSINTTGATANTSSILDVSSTLKGVLIPRMSKTEKNTIPTPATGLLIFQATPDSIGFYYYNGAKWVWLTDGTNADTSAWKITGNSNITASRFLGTLNDSALKFRVKNQPAGMVDSISFNTGLGYGTLRNVNYAGALQGKENSAFGYRALDSVTTGSGNTATGTYSAVKITTGIWNTANGYYALENNTAGNYNTGIGASALDQVTTASNNVGVGTYAGFNVTSANNTFVGFIAGQGVAGRSTGDQNTSVGGQSLYVIRSGIRNTALGFSALFSDSTGSNNVSVGTAARQLNLRGGDNITIGSFAGNSDTASNRTVVIGRRAAQSNQRDEVVAIGYESLLNNSMGLNVATQADSALYNTGVGYHSLVTNTKGGWNTALGYQAGNNNTTGFYNTSVGVNALLSSTIGNYNTAIGTGAGDSYINGNNNTFLGSFSDVNAASRINATAVGAFAQVNQDNSMVLGSINGVNSATADTKVGVGTTAPLELTHIANGNLLNSGTFGSSATLNNSGAGTRMFFYPRKAAFRAGFVNGTQWDDANIGNFSIALGNSNSAKTDNSVSIGADNIAETTPFAVAIGRGNHSTGFASLAMGHFSEASGDYSASIGLRDTVSGFAASAMGSNNKVFATDAFAAGWNNLVTGDGAAALGNQNYAPSYGEATLGNYATQYTALGAGTINAADRVFTVGNGTSTSSRSNALVILKNGNTGIGISVPTTKLDVRGDFLLGTNGTALNEIIKQTVVGTIPTIGGNGITNFPLTVPNAVVGATVVLSPATALATGTTIAYAFVTGPNAVTVYAGNVSTSTIAIQSGVSFYVTLIR